MRIDVKECARLLLEQDDILILTHAHPDGDTLGCGLPFAGHCCKRASSPM